MQLGIGHDANRTGRGVAGDANDLAATVGYSDQPELGVVRLRLQFGDQAAGDTRAPVIVSQVRGRRRVETVTDDLRKPDPLAESHHVGARVGDDVRQIFGQNTDLRLGADHRARHRHRRDISVCQIADGAGCRDYQSPDRKGKSGRQTHRRINRLGREAAWIRLIA